MYVAQDSFLRASHQISLELWYISKKVCRISSPIFPSGWEGGQGMARVMQWYSIYYTILYYTILYYTILMDHLCCVLCYVLLVCTGMAK